MSFFLKIKNNYLYGFLLRSALLIFLYIFFYYFLREFNPINNTYVDILNIYADFLVKASKFLLELFGYEVVTYGKTVKIIENYYTAGVFLNRGCMGRDFLLYFIGFIIAFPGKIKDKAWYIPMGILILIFANILRICGLAIVAYCCNNTNIGINNHDLFKYAAWTVLIILGYIWINKLSPLSKKNKPV